MKRNAKNLRLYKRLIKEIWDELEHVCEDCGCQIGEWDSEIGDYVPRWHNFAHTDGRITEENCMNKEKIKLKCFKDHAQKDHKLKVSNSEWLK